MEAPIFPICNKLFVTFDKITRSQILILNCLNSVKMSSKHLQCGDKKPAFDNKKNFRIYSMKFCPFAQVGNIGLYVTAVTKHMEKSSVYFHF